MNQHDDPPRPRRPSGDDSTDRDAGHPPTAPQEILERQREATTTANDLEPADDGMASIINNTGDDGTAPSG
jgi:hypothetical protein